MKIATDSEIDMSLKGWLSPYFIRIDGGWHQTRVCPRCSRWSFLKWLKTCGRRFRWLNKQYADLRGYFWLPCKLCGEMFGGHEINGSLYTGNGRGHAVCFDCRERAKILTIQNVKLEYELSDKDGRPQ